MKRFSAGLAAPALLVVFVPFVGCLPDPDISKLPPYDAGGLAPDGAVIPIADASIDGTLGQDAGSDTGSADSAPPLGTVSGIVIDYTQGNGKGVVPGALVSVAPPGSTAPMTATTDANGLFTIAGVPAEVTVQISVSKPTDLAKGVAYSTTSLVTTVGAGQTVNVFPVLHEGCFQNFVLNGGPDAGNLPITMQNANCGVDPNGTALKRPGAYAAMTFDATSFKDPIGGSLYAGSIRVEMIPLAYPANPAQGGAPDLSWAFGLPGVTTPPGLLGAAEYRVVKSDPGQPDDGNLLALQDPTNHPVTIAVPVYTAPTVAALTYSYSPASGNWSAEKASPPGAVQLSSGNLQYVTIQVPHLSWWGATNGVAGTTCITGTLQQAGSALPNVVVHAAGVNYLGSSTGQTNSAGLFCIDVTQQVTDGGAAQVGLVAEWVSDGGVAYGTPTPQLIPVSLLGGAGSCQTGTGCQALAAPINLAANLTCVSGSVQMDSGAPAVLNVALIDVNGTYSYAQAAGISPSAYIGQVTLAPGTGSFCALAPPGSALELQNPADVTCVAPFANDNLGMTFPGGLIGESVPSCSATGACSDGGVGLTYGCYVP